MVGLGSYLDEDVVVEGLDGGRDADDVLEILIPAVVEVAGGIGDGVLVEQLVVVVEVGDVLAQGGLGHFVRIGLLRRDFLRRHMLFEFARHEVFVRRVDGDGQPGRRDGREDVFRKRRLA